MIDLGTKWNRITAFAVAVLLFFIQFSVAGHADEIQDAPQSDPACELCLLYSGSDDACPVASNVSVSFDFVVCYTDLPNKTSVVNSYNDAYVSRAPPVQLNYS